MEKLCPRCKETKPISQFGKHSGKRDGLQSHCKKCRSTYIKVWYSAEHKLQKKRVRATKQKIVDHIRSYRASHPCVDCGESDPVVLEFDHVRGKKKFSLGVAQNIGVGFDKVVEEIAKCEIRCANCHRRVTAARRMREGGMVTSPGS